MAVHMMGDGCALSYRLDGPEDAPTLVLSNSLGTTLDMWAPQMPAFAQHFRVLRYDSRGHGASSAPAGAYGLDRLGRDVLELVEALGISRFSFCGLSKGGMVGQWLGARAGERLDRLVLCNTSADMGPPTGWDARIAAIQAGGMEAIADAVIERWFTPDFRRERSDVVQSLRRVLASTDAAGYAGCCAAIRDMDLRITAPLISTQTLVIAGDADPATPIAHSQLLNETIEGSRLAVLSAAHLSNWEQPDRFTQVVLEFLLPRGRRETTTADGANLFGFAFRGP